MALYNQNSFFSERVLSAWWYIILSIGWFRFLGVDSVVVNAFQFSGVLLTTFLYLLKNKRHTGRYLYWILLFSYFGVFAVAVGNDSGLLVAVYSFVLFILIGALNYSDYRAIKNGLIVSIIFGVALIFFRTIFNENGFADEGARNQFSSILVLSFALLLCLEGGSEKWSLLVYFTGFVASFFLIGRSGIIAMSLLLIYVLVYRNRKLFYIFICVSLSVLVVFSDVIYNFIEFATNYSNFSRGLESSRTDIWADYYAGLDLEQFLLGGTPMSQIFIEYAGNPHNSFIFGHIRYGFPYLVTLGLFMIVYLTSKPDVRSSVALLIMVIRSALDSIAFIGSLDLYIILLIGFSIASQRESRSDDVRKCAGPCTTH